MYNNTTIRITKTTKEKLKALGKKGDTYDDVISKLIGEIEKCRGE